MAQRSAIAPIPLARDGRHTVLRMRGSDVTALKRLVFKRYPDWEWGTFFRFGYRRTAWGLALTYVEPYLPGAGDLDRQSGMTVFRDQYTRRAFDLAQAPEGLAIGVVHSHPMGCRTSPSPLDDDMDRYFSTELSAFSRGAPYFSLILQESDGTGLTFSGRVFDRGEWLPLRWLLTTGPTVNRYGSELEQPAVAASPAAGVTETTDARLRSLFGDRAAARLRGATVGVIGCSGTGSPAVEVLGRAGVGEFVLVDPQRVSASNHERMHGMREEHLSLSPLPYKVDVLRRMLVEINPKIRVTSFVGNILHEAVLDELVRCDVILGCTDTFHGRVALSDIAAHYLVPSIDVGVLMDGEQGQVTTQLVEINSYEPELPCAFCGQLVDAGALAEELMTETEREQRRRAAAEAERRGDPADQYWKGRPRQLNTVGYLTTMAGSLAAGYAEGRLTGAFETPHERLQFDIGQPGFGFVTPNRTGNPDCACTRHVGWADRAKSYRNVVLPSHWPKRAILVSKP